jgi:hypothetical protein
MLEFLGAGGPAARITKAVSEATVADLTGSTTEIGDHLAGRV